MRFKKWLFRILLRLDFKKIINHVRSVVRGIWRFRYWIRLLRLILNLS